MRCLGWEWRVLGEWRVLELVGVSVEGAGVSVEGAQSGSRGHLG